MIPAQALGRSPSEITAWATQIWGILIQVIHSAAMTAAKAAMAAMVMAAMAMEVAPATTAHLPSAITAWAIRSLRVQAVCPTVVAARAAGKAGVVLARVVEIRVDRAAVPAVGSQPPAWMNWIKHWRLAMRPALPAR